MDTAALARAAVRLSRRYQEEIVEAFNLCPWAQRARIQGEVTERVVLCEEPEMEAVAEAVGEIDTGGYSIGLILLPCLRLDRTDFGRFVSRMADGARSDPRAPSAHFAFAAFHPDAAPDLTDPDRLIPFLRRTPDPTIQIVRQSALDAVREGFSDGTQFVDINALSTLHLSADETLPLRDRIARSNHRTVRRVGVEAVEEQLANILRDRDKTYAALGLGRSR